MSWHKAQVRLETSWVTVRRIETQWHVEDPTTRKFFASVTEGLGLNDAPSKDV